MRKEEKQPPVWEIRDPKPNVVRSGHMEDRVYNRTDGNAVERNEVM